MRSNDATRFNRVEQIHASKLIIIFFASSRFIIKSNEYAYIDIEKDECKRDFVFIAISRFAQLTENIACRVNCSLSTLIDAY